MAQLPLVPVLATFGVQVCASMTLFAVPVMAPAMALDLGLPPALIGAYMSIAYVAATGSALLCPGFIIRFGGIRASQVALLGIGLGLALATAGGIPALVASALVLGCVYALPIPAGAHVLARHTPAKLYHVAFSVRQSGVPVGGLVAGAATPAMVLAFGWRPSLLAYAAAPVVLAALLVPLRARLDTDREPGRSIVGRGMFRPLGLLLQHPVLRVLGFAGIFFAGLEVAFATYVVVTMIERVGVGYVEAGLALSVFQAGGLTGRLLFGVVADRLADRQRLIAMLGIGMAVAGAAAAGFGPVWPFALVLAVCFVAGFTSGGWTGIGIGEAARIAGAGGAAIGSGAMLMAMFLGVIVCPSVFAAIVASGAGYPAAYLALAAGAALGATALLLRRPVAGGGP